MHNEYVIISGTNRKDSNTHKVAKQYQQAFALRNIKAELLSLEKVDLSERNRRYEKMENELLLHPRKVVVISPEYNGSIPGVLKTLIDLSDYKRVWWGKKALLVGISTGRSGNVRGMEHLTSVLHYMRVVVHPNKLPISSVHKLLNGRSAIHDPDTVNAINDQIEEFIKF